MKKTPRLLRPMMSLGMIVILIAVFGLLTRPAWRSSLGGLVILVTMIVIGVVAIIFDFRSLQHELNQSEDEKPEE